VDRIYVRDDLIANVIIHRVPLVTFVQGYEAKLKAIALKLRLGIERNRKAGKIPYKLLTIIALPLICLKRAFFKLGEAELTTSKHQTTDSFPMRSL